MDLTLYKTTIQQASLSCLVAYLLFVFLEPECIFQVQLRRHVALEVLPVVVGLFVAQFEYYSALLGLLAWLVIVCIGFCISADVMALQMVCVWISTHLAVYANLSESTFACLALAFANTQFMNKPYKETFDTMNVIFVCAGLRFCSASHFFETLLTVMASLFSVMAAVLVQHDNDVILRLILPEKKIPTTYVRQVTHGGLLFVGFLATFVKSFMLRSESQWNFEIGVALVLLITGRLFVNYTYNKLDLSNTLKCIKRLLTEREVCTGKYQTEVLTVRNKRSEVRT